MADNRPARRRHDQRVTDRLIVLGAKTRPLQLGPARVWILVLVMLTVLLVIVQLGPIAQNPAYHAFADTRALAGLPHTLNVLSNLMFLMVGVTGLVVTLHMHRHHPRVIWIPYGVLYAGLALICFGSGWYHLAPDNASLMWDRLPMTIVFMGFFASVFAEVVDRRLAHVLLPFLLALGIFSVLYWHASEQRGAGDLRLYVLVQFLPMLLIPLLLLFYPRPRHYLPYVLAMLGLYAVSKIFEFLDGEVFALGEIVSGHTLKHVLAAAAPACLLPMLWRRG